MSDAEALRSVRAVEVTKIYGRHRALHRVSLALGAGEVTALLGPNGSGKSTLLSIFSTLVRPTSGAVHFDDRPPERAGLERGRIGVLAHASMTYGELTARENLALFARLYDRPRPADEAAEWIAALGLEEFADRPSRTFSRGTLQRLGLARALIGRPSLILLDEPFTGLDQRSIALVVAKVRALKAAGALVLLISHDLGITAELADRAAFLVRGKLAAVEPGPFVPAALHRRYAELTDLGARGG